MNKLYLLLTFAHTAALLCASIAMIADGPHIYIYVFATLGMTLSVLTWIAGKREIAQRRRQRLFKMPEEWDAFVTELRK